MLPTKYVSLGLAVVGWGGSIVVAARIIIESNARFLKFLSEKSSGRLFSSSRLKLLVRVGEVLNVGQGG